MHAKFGAEVDGWVVSATVLVDVSCVVVVVCVVVSVVGSSEVSIVSSVVSSVVVNSGGVVGATVVGGAVDVVSVVGSNVVGSVVVVVVRYAHASWESWLAGEEQGPDAEEVHSWQESLYQQVYSDLY